MSATGQKDTPPELKIRKLLLAMGLRYRVDHSVLTKPRRKGDIVFQRLKVAIFVDGCFWHGCPIHGTWPKANAEFWRKKIETNRQRDLDTNRRLEKAGWKVIRIWEHENPREAAEMIAEVVEYRRRECL
jgi:DNA mismatch endonuclease (patch repair protein)